VYRSTIVSTGSYLPEKILLNEDMAKMVDTSDEWITSRVGIKQRHIASVGELTSDLGFKAAQNALKSTGIEASTIDAIIVATTTPDDTFPATAVKIQEKLGASKAFAFDIQAVCSGFIYALSVADNFIRSGQVKNALVIGAETMSKIVDWNDRSTCVLFADGAGAMLLQRSENERGIISTHLYSDGHYRDALYVDGGPGSSDKVGVIKMDGRLVMKHAVEKLGDSIEKALAVNNMTQESIDWFIPHQANIRIINALMHRFSLPEEKVVITIDKHGNTSAASIPLAFDYANKQGKLKLGDLILTEAMGGGFTWGSALIRW
jgi:3-oxoacyl-[acyl-carrier-protein] synthase-3